MTSNNCAVSLVYATAEVWSPMDGDYRINKGAKAITTGSASWLAQIPAAYRDTDYYGNPRTTDGVVHCGAVQDVTDETGSGVAFRLSGQGGVWKMNDVSFNEGYRTWFQRTGWPFTVKVSFEPDSATRGIVRYYLSVAPYWPLQDDTVYLVPEEEHVKTMSFVLRRFGERPLPHAPESRGLHGGNARPRAGGRLRRGRSVLERLEPRLREHEEGTAREGRRGFREHLHHRRGRS